ncbi:MAG: hypothetical protein SGBAC_012663 [Bacillariaceae sp.]
MLNTFQNYKLHKIRQDERELHLRTIEALSIMTDDDEEPSAVASMTEGILRGPSDMRERSALLCLRAPPKKIIIFVAIALISPIIALYVGLNARNPPTTSMTMGSRIRLMSMIQGWNTTSLERLEDYQSPPARALEWILSMDIDWNDMNALQEKFALATLFFATQSRTGNDIAYIDGNAISGVLPSEGLAKMMLLHEFQLHDNIISGNLPEELERLKMLRILYCDGNLLFGALPDGMGQLTRLEALFLFGNQISGPIPRSFAQLSSLKEFQVHENQLSGPLGEDVISAWTNLQILRLHNNSFDGAFPSALSTLKELRIMQLHGNNFVGTVPDALCNSTELGILTSDCNDRVECFCCTRCFSH